MQWISPNARSPDDGQIVLIKLKKSRSYYEDIRYYICETIYTHFKDSENSYYFSGALSSGDVSFDIDEVFGWMPVEELDKL